MESQSNHRKSSRRRNGEGTTYRYKNGWRTKITRGAQTVTAMGRSEQESRRKAKEKLARLPIYDSTLLPEGGKITLSEFMVPWMTKQHVNQITATTYRRYLSLMRVHILPSMGHLKLREINKNHVNKLMELMNANGQSARSCQQARALLSAAFKRAVQDDLIGENPVKRSRSVKNDGTEIHPLSLEEVKALLEATDDIELQARVRMAVLYGLRQGEALGLQWKNVDLEKGTIFIWQQLQKVDKSYVFVKLKSKSSVRTLELDSETLASLKAHKASQNSKRLLMGSDWQDFDLVFPGLKGQPMNSHTDFNKWQKALAAANLPTKRLHDARHTCATLLYDQGMDIETIRRFLGHASVLLTSRTYVHHSARQMRGAASALSSLGF